MPTGGFYQPDVSPCTCIVKIITITCVTLSWLHWKKSMTFKWHFISGLLLGPLAVPGEGRALPWAALSVGNGHVQRKMQDGLQGEHCLPDAEVQGDHGGQRLYFVEFDLVVPQSAQFWLGRCKLGHKWQSSWARLCNFKKSLQNVLGVPDMISTLEIEAFCLF